MSPGINGDGPRNTGTLPKSNRRNDRNRERSAVNQQIANRSAYHGNPPHFNNLFQLDWQPVSEREREPRVSRAAKNSNTRSVSSLLPASYSTTYQDLSDFASHTAHSTHSLARQCNYSAEVCIPWLKMVPPTDPRTQSPPRLPQGTKPSNVNKMPDRNQVESRLNQIRDYIRVTATMMDSLSQSSDPRAQAQNEKLSRMVEDLHDSETKLSKLLEQYHNQGISDENGENGREDIDERGDAREMQLRRNVEEYQNKLVQLQEHQASLVGMQLRVRERLNEARQAQQILLQQENQNTSNSATWEGNRSSLPGPTNVEQLESETEALRGKLAQLQTKKKHMDHLVAELQAIDASDRGSCSSEGSRNTIRDKAAELEAMKAQLAHIKALMEDGTKIRDSMDSTSELEQDVDVNGEGAADVEITEDMANSSFECRSDSDDVGHGKLRNSVPTLEDIQNVTRELKEQSALLQATRAELQRLKQPLTAATHPTSSSSFSSSSPPPALIPLSATEKKQSNNVTTETQPMQAKRRQLEDLIKKEQTQPSNVNRDVQAPDQNSQRSSGSQASHTSTPANIWPPSVGAGGSNEQSVDGVSTSENLLDIGSQMAAIENSGFNGNWWACPVPPPPMNQGQHASVEYYRQLLLGSQAQQLQMMGTTIHHCCQLLWAQQRELQSVRASITQLQSQNQAPQRTNNAENQEEYSNLSRSVHNLGDTLDATLPPSSSLPNLVSLPNSSASLSHTPIVTSNSQQQQQQQLNNQVPPGNRANNYWDNFRSYSRQNLLSGNVKTMTDSPAAIANSACSANTTNTSGNSVNSSLMKDKRNREQGTDNLPLPLSGTEAQYSLNLQLSSNLQQQDRENATIRSNIMANEVSQQVDNLWEEAHSSFRLPSNDDNPFNNLSSEMKEAICSLIAVNKRRPDYLIIILREIKAISEDHKLRPHLLRSLRALQDTQTTLNNPLYEIPDLTPSESCQSSDEDSDVGAMLDFSLENQSSVTELVATTSHVDTASSPASSQVPLIDHLEISGTFSLDCASALPSTSNTKPGYNEDLAEADQSRPESSRNSHQKLSTNDIDDEEGQEEGASYLIAAESTVPDLESLAAKTEDERAEDTELDRFLTRLHH